MATEASRSQRISSIDEAGDDALTFATSEKYLEAALRGKAAAIVVEASLATLRSQSR